jgi:hypothetical protein
MEASIVLADLMPEMKESRSNILLPSAQQDGQAQFYQLNAQK